MAGIASFILDTSAYSAFKRGEVRLRAWFSGDYTIIVPLVVIGELRSGFAAGSRTEESEGELRRFLDAPNVQTISLSLATTAEFAELFARLRKTGVAVSSNDLWVAALAKEKDLPILTLDQDFRRIAGIRTLPE